LAQLWTAPQWAQVNFCRFIFAPGQRFCSIVRPVSVSFEVEGQRTSKLFRSAQTFGFGRRRGGSKQNRLAMSEPVNNPRFGGIVGRHLHPHTIARRQANETFAHFARDMRKHEMIVRKRDPKHRSGQHAHDRSL